MLVQVANKRHHSPVDRLRVASVIQHFRRHIIGRATKSERAVFDAFREVKANQAHVATRAEEH